MELLKSKLNKYQLPVKGKETKLQSWQGYAIEVCQQFRITGRYRAMIFRHAKNNISYLKGRVENTKEKFGTEKLEDKGNYLISLFRNKKPWST